MDTNHSIQVSLEDPTLAADSSESSKTSASASSLPQIVSENNLWKVVTDCKYCDGQPHFCTVSTANSLFIITIYVFLFI